MSHLNVKLSQLRAELGHSADVHVPLAAFAYRLIDKDGNVILSPDDLPTTLSNLLKSSGAVSAVAQNVGKIVTPYSPLTGATISANVKGQDESIILTPAGTIAALTINFPLDASSRLGQIIRLNSHQIVTALTIGALGATPTLRGTATTALAVDTPITFEKVDTNTWQRL